MKNTGPDSPQTVRGLLNRRSQRALLDTRTHQEADILTAPMVGPFGKGFHTLRTPAGTDYIVGDASGITFAPNTQVMVANPGGLGDRAVLGGAPANKKGAVSRSRNPRRRGTVVLEANQYAFGNDGSNNVAMLYQDGTFVSTRLAVTAFGGAYVGCILTDPSLLVGDGSALMSDGPLTSGVQVWDVEGGVVYSYSSPSGWLLAAYPYYHGGLVYILEVEDGTAITGHATAAMQFRLRTAYTDLTNAATISTFATTATDYDHGNGTDHYDGIDEVTAGLMVNSSHALAYVHAQSVNGNHEVATLQHYQFRITLSGGSESHRDCEDDVYDLVSSLSATLSSGGFLSAGGTAVLAKSDDASSEATILVSGMTGLPASINVAPDGVTYQTFNLGPSGIWRGGFLITNSIDAFDATPTYPTAMFYFGV